MFKFLKKLFFEDAEEKIVEKESIKVDELEKWFKLQSDKILNELDIKVTGIKTKINDEIAKTKDSLAVLSVANLHNPKISVRETQFMEGNRKSYILTVNNFLRNIDIGDDSYSDLLRFCNDFEDKLEKFGRTTLKPYHILQEFFANEGRNIAINIKNLDSLINELKGAIGTAKIYKIDEIKDSIVELSSKLNQKKDSEILIEDKNKVKQGAMKNKQETEKELENLIKSKEYNHLNELKANKEVLLASIREHNAKIVHAFSVMERPLRKLTRMVVEDSPLLTKYIENPVIALISDNEMKIVKLLNKLEKNINNYTLDLKDKKREKVLETVKGLTEEFLREFIHKHNELNNKLNNLEKEIDEHEALKTENKLNYDLSNVMGNLEKVNNEILNQEQELSKVNISEMKNNLEKNINGLLGTDVVIS